MKPKMLIAMLFVGLVSQQWAVSQTDTNSTATSEPAVSGTTPATDTNETTGATTNNAPATTAVDTESPTNAETPGETAGASAPTIVVSTNVLPIQFQDVPITTAIENLARLAGINYLLDPQIGYGQTDQSGRIKAEPTVSVRWDNITAQQALMAVLDNYGLRLVEDPKNKIARITIQNPNVLPPLLTRVIQLKYSGVSNMQAAVEGTFADKRSKVILDSRTSQLVVVAPENEQDAVSTLVDQLDKPTRQVLIETRLMEISSSPSTVKGMDWSGTLAAQNISFGNGQVQPATTTFQAPGTPVTTTLPGGRTITTTPGYTTTTTIGSTTTGSGSTSGSTSGSSSSSGSTATTVGGLIPNGLAWNTLSGLTPAIGFLNADGLHAVLSFLNSDSDAQVIATPRVVTLDNEMAHIEVTRAEPIFNNTAGTQGSPGGSQVNYTNLGTILDVTPRISANDFIWLKVQPEVSSKFGIVTKTVAGFVSQADEYDIRKVTTQVLIPNANTLVMGGFIRDNTKNTYNKVPIMGDIPILGYAFRSEGKSMEKDNLLIFITPTIIKDTDFRPTTTKFLQSSPMGAKPPMNPKSMWNSAKPRDWSSPKNTDPYLNTIDQKTAEAASTPANP
jgi:type II secretory pathway component GspD/PulD (secretin)